MRADADGDGGVDLQELLNELRADEIDLEVSSINLEGSSEGSSEAALSQPSGTKAAALDTPGALAALSGPSSVDEPGGSNAPTASLAAASGSRKERASRRSRQAPEAQSESQAQERAAKEARAERKRRVHALVRQVPAVPQTSS